SINRLRLYQTHGTSASIRYNEHQCRHPMYPGKPK
ncbi:MAG: hypothetical protein ACI8W8_003487, partial [Rhodothermales bacterium]